MKLRSLLMKTAPDRLWQSINPWFQNAHFNFFSIDLGTTPYPETEQAILHEVGSYGRQIGHLSDVLEILLQRVDRSRLTQAENDVLKEFEADAAKVRKIKRRLQR